MRRECPVVNFSKHNTAVGPRVKQTDVDLLQLNNQLEEQQNHQKSNTQLIRPIINSISAPIL